MRRNISATFKTIKDLFFSRLVRSVGVYGTANLLNNAIPFLLLPVLTRYLSPTDYGIIAMFQVILLIVGALTGLSVHGAIFRQYFEKNTIHFPRYIGNCFYILGASSVFVAVVFWIFSAWISKFTHYPLDWLWAVLLVSVCQFVIFTLLIIWQVTMRPLLYGAFQVGLSIINISLSLWFIIYLRMGWQGRILGQVIAYSVFAIISFIVIRKNGFLDWRYDPGYIRNALKFGVPLIPHDLGSLAMNIADRVLITNMVGLGNTGVYTVGVQIGSVISLIPDSFNRAWSPWFFGKLKENNLAQKLKIVKFTYLYFIFMLLAAFLLAWFAPWFLKFFVGRDFRAVSNYILWIALGCSFEGMYRMVACYIFYVQKTFLLALITLLSGIAAIFLNYSLIRLHGVIGAAQGTMLGIFISFILTWFLASRLYKMPYNMKI